MRRALALLLLASAACRSRRSRPRATRAPRPRAARRPGRGLEPRRPRGLHAGYWRSPELVFCSGATVTKGWEATLERYRKRYQAEGREMGTLRFDSIEVLPFGPDARRRARRLPPADEATARSRTGSSRCVLRRVDGAWRIVHDHTSSAE